MPVNNSIPCMNSKAIALLQDGCFNKATEILREAVTQLLLSVDKGTQEVPCQPPAHELLKIQSVQINELSNTSKHMKLVQDHTTFSLYDRAFVIVGPGVKQTSCPEGQNRLSASLLYNLGLAYHLMGMLSNGVSQHKSLKKALKLYKSVLVVVGRDPTSDFGNIFNLAAWNNMGHIYAQSFSTNQVQHCLEQLRLTMAITNSTDEALSEDYLHFRMNIWLLHGKDVMAAPAA